MNNELISVIIPVHNGEKYIKECLDSVINQSYKNIEILIVNDCSDDDSIKIIKKIKDKRIKIINLDQRSGVSTARNKGIELSKGKYITFLDSDDYWTLDKLEREYEFIKGKAFIYSGYAFLKGDKVHKVKVPTEITYKKTLKNTTIFTSTVMFNMNYLKKDDIYMPLVERGQDTLTWWKVLKKCNKAYGITDVLAFYRVGNKSLSSNKIRALKRTWNIYKIEKVSLPKRIIYFSCYVFNAIKRRLV